MARRHRRLDRSRLRVPARARTLRLAGRICPRRHSDQALGKFVIYARRRSTPALNTEGDLMSTLAGTHALDLSRLRSREEFDMTAIKEAAARFSGTSASPSPASRDRRGTMAAMSSTPGCANAATTSSPSIQTPTRSKATPPMPIYAPSPAASRQWSSRPGPNTLRQRCASALSSASSTSGCTAALGAGSVSETATAYGRAHGVSVIDGGCPCMFGPTADRGHMAMRFLFTLTGNVPREV